MKSSTSHDGVLHGNTQMVDRYDEAHGKKRPKMTGGESGGAHEPEGHDEIKQVVDEHGPAHKIIIQHDHDGGEHHVTSHHEDGHIHKQMHDSATMAHAHAAHAGGVSDTNELHEAHGGQQEQDTLEEAGHRGEIERTSHRMKAGGGLMPEHGIGSEG
jgi:hypothetical protein